MQEVDVSPLLKLEPTQPEEAAENIKMSTMFDTEPDAVVPIRSQLKKEAEIQQLPSTRLSEPVADIMGRSQQHASVMREDLEKWGAVGKQVSFAIDTIKERFKSRDVFDLSFRKAMGEKLTAEEEYHLDDVNEYLASRNIQEEYEYNFAQSIPGNLASTVVDQFSTLVGGRDLIGKAISKTARGGISSMAIGAGAAMTAVQVRDSFRQSTGQVYNDLSRVLRDPNTGEISDIAEDERKKLAIGAGLIMAALDSAGTIVGAASWAKNIMSPRLLAKQMLKPEGAKWKALAKTLVGAGLAEGLTESAQEITQIFAEEIGKTWDGSETKFIEGMSNAIEKAPTHAKRVAKSGILGTLAGGLFSASGVTFGVTFEAIQNKMKKNEPLTAEEEEILNYVHNRSEPTQQAADQLISKMAEDVRVNEEIQEPTDIVGPSTELTFEQRNTRAVQTQVALDQMINLTKDTKANELTPEVVDEARDRMWEEDGVDHLWISKESAAVWANTDKKAEALRNILDPSGVAASQINSPIRVTVSQMSRLAEQFPDATTLVKLEPHDPSVQGFVSRLEAEEKKRAAVEEDLPQNLPQGTPIERPIDGDINGEAAYMAIPEDEYQLMPPEYKEAVIKARTKVSESIKEDAHLRMNQLIDLETQRLQFNEESEAIAEAEADFKIQTVESFVNNDNRQIDDLTPFQKSQMEKGRPIYAIDPKSLPNSAIREFWTGNKTLRDRKVFAEGGMQASEVAAIFGLKNTSELFDLLSKTPTVIEAAEARVAARQSEIEAEARNNTEFDQSALAQAYDKETENRIAEIKIMREKHWGSFKKGIKRAAAPPPKLDALNERAKTTINTTRVRDLNINQWKVAERVSQRKCVESVLRDDLFAYEREKTNAALAAQLAKEAHIATGKLNRAFEWVARLESSKRMQKTLKDAGMWEGVKNILDIYNFDPKLKGQSKADAFTKLAKELVANGEGDVSINPVVAEEMSTKKAVKELTVEQVLDLVGKMKQVMHDARMINEWLGDYKKEKDRETVEVTRAAFKVKSEAHPGYNIDYAVDPVDKTAGRNFMNALMGAEAHIMNIKAITDHLDQGQMNGFFEKMLWQPFQGVGSYEGKYGLKARSVLQGGIRKKMFKAIKKYGPEFKHLGVTPAFIPEFKESIQLSRGKLTKMDLIMILANTGTDSNWQRVENFKIGNDKISREKMFEILQRELTAKDFDLVQDVWDMYRDLKPQIAESHKTLTGQELEFVEPLSFTAHGKEYAGGYYPIKIKRDTSHFADMAQNQIAHDPSETSYSHHPAYDGIVRSSFTKSRTGTTNVIDLDVAGFTLGFDEVAHAITMSVPVRDTMKLLKDEEISMHLKAILGIEKYNAMLDSFAGLTNSLGAQNAMMYAKLSQTTSKLISGLTGTYLLNQIMLNVHTFGVNFLTLPKIAQKMGLKTGPKHMMNALAQMTRAMSTGHSYKDIITYVAESDPSVLRDALGLDNYSATTFRDFLPKKRIVKNKAYNQAKVWQEAFIKASMNLVFGQQDIFFKAVAFVAGRNQFLAGEAVGFSFQDVMKMSEEERNIQANAYAVSLTSSTTQQALPSDKAPIQVMQGTKEFVWMFNEMRSTINMNVNDLKLITYDARKGVKKIKQGDTNGGIRSFFDAGGRALTLVLIGGLVSQVMTNLARGVNPFPEEDEEAADEEPINWSNAGSWALNTFTSVDGYLDLGTNMLLNNAPILRSIVYAEKTGKGIILPTAAMFGVVAKGAEAAMVTLGDELNVVEADQELTNQEWNALYNLLGLAVQGAPVRAMIMIRDFVEENENPFIRSDLNAFQESPVETTVKKIDHFVDKFDNKDPNAPKTELQEVVDKAKAVRSRLQPTPRPIELTEEPEE